MGALAECIFFLGCSLRWEMAGWGGLEESGVSAPSRRVARVQSVVGRRVTSGRSGAHPEGLDGVCPHSFEFLRVCEAVALRRAGQSASQSASRSVGQSVIRSDAAGWQAGMVK